MLEEFVIMDGIASLFGNKHADNYERGCRYLKQAMEFTNNEDELKNAIREFIEVNEEDKLYLQVAAKFNLAICHCMMLDFEKSKSYIWQIENIEYDWFTLKKDTIEDLRNECPNLRASVNELEQSVIKMMADIRNQNGAGNVLIEEATVVPSRNKWKIATIVLIVVIILIIIGMIVLHFVNLV